MGEKYLSIEDAESTLLSAGSQWKADSRVGKLDVYVDKLTVGLSAEERRTTFLDVELVLK